MGWAGKKNKSSLSFANPLLLPSTSPDSCRAFMAFVLMVMVLEVAELKNLFGCELLGEGREFPLSSEGPWRYPRLSKHQG